MGQGTQVGVAFVGAVEITAARGSQTELDGHVGVLGVLGRRMAARHHLHALATVGLELGEQRVFGGGREVVAGGVGNHGHAACIAYPAYGIAQPCPAVGHKPRLAFGQKTAEHFIGVGTDPGFHQKAGKVRARNQFGVARVLQCALERPPYAHRRQLVGHFAGTLVAAIAGVVQALGQRRLVRIEAQPHDVNRDMRKRHRHLGAREVGQAHRRGGRHRPVLATDFIVVGQRPQLHAVGLGPAGQRLGRERAVRHDRVAMEVGVQDVGSSVDGHAAHCRKQRLKPLLPPPETAHGAGLAIRRHRGGRPASRGGAGARCG